MSTENKDLLSRAFEEIWNKPQRLPRVRPHLSLLTQKGGCLASAGAAFNYHAGNKYPTLLVMTPNGCAPA